MITASELGGLTVEMLIFTGQVLVLLWPASLVALALAICALFFPTPHVKSYFGPRFSLLAASYLFPFCILLMGLLLRYKGPPHPNWREPPAWRGYVVQSGLAVHLLVIVVAVALLKGRRIRAAAFLIPGLWLSFCALAPAGFAVYGVGP